MYALYSVVFRCRMHTNSASQPYSRKGFQFCIQCIQRIPTPPVFGFFPLLEPEYMNTANTPARLRVFGHGRISTVRGRRAAYPADTGGELYSAAFVNTCERAAWSMFRTPETGRIGRDTPCLYALYSDVFRRRMHTNSARKPYCRKGFGICIQCIQRIPTPPVFAFFLLLGREYTHTCPLEMPSRRHAEPRMHRTPPTGQQRRESSRNRASRARTCRILHCLPTRMASRS